MTGPNPENVKLVHDKKEGSFHGAASGFPAGDLQVERPATQQTKETDRSSSLYLGRNPQDNSDPQAIK